MPITINGSTGIAGVDGSASTPAIQGTDTNTGVTFPAADTVAVSTGGSERMRVDSSGNVGIGTSSPGQKLSVNGVAGANYFQIITNSSAPAVDAAVYRPADGTLGFVANASERARISSGGNFMVGRTSQIFGGSGGFFVENNGTVWCERDSSAALLLARYGGDSDGAIALFHWGSSRTFVGSISVTSNATAYNTSSDYRLKENIQPMQNALATVAQLNPVTYTWKSDGSSGQGFIAHELQAVVPDAVSGEKDAVRTVDVLDENGTKIGTKEEPVYQGVDTSFLVATLTKAIQELNAKVDALQAEINALRGAA